MGWPGSGAARRSALLREVAADLGADVPFFLSGGTALGLGRGEEIYPLVDLPPHAVVVVQPPFGVSTAEAYAWYDEDRAAGLKEPRELQLLPVPWPTRAAQMVNDLEPPVVRRHPEIGALRTALREAGAVAAAMSGSGSAVFGLFRSQAAARKALEPLSRGGARAVVTRTLGRGEYRAAIPADAGAGPRHADARTALGRIDRHASHRVHLPFCGRARTARLCVSARHGVGARSRCAGPPGSTRSRPRRKAGVARTRSCEQRAARAAIHAADREGPRIHGG